MKRKECQPRLDGGHGNDLLRLWSSDLLRSEHLQACPNTDPPQSFRFQVTLLLVPGPCSPGPGKATPSIQKGKKKPKPGSGLETCWAGHPVVAQGNHSHEKGQVDKKDTRETLYPKAGRQTLMALGPSLPMTVCMASASSPHGG